MGFYKFVQLLKALYKKTLFCPQVNYIHSRNRDKTKKKKITKKTTAEKTQKNKMYSRTKKTEAQT